MHIDHREEKIDTVSSTSKIAKSEDYRYSLPPKMGQNRHDALTIGTKDT